MNQHRAILCPEPKRPEMTSVGSGPGTDNRYELHVCRGLQGDCPFALWRDSSVVRALEDILSSSSWLGRVAGPAHRGALRHHVRFKVALAACPNACTMPQIRDVGIIARLTPQGIGPGCNGCGSCRKACREEAITMREDRARLHRERCVGCGACTHACPQEAIESEGMRLHVLVGGRMGRHPRWAEELCIVEVQSVPGVLLAFLDYLGREARPPEGAAAVVERTGLEPLRQHVLRTTTGSSLG